MRSLRSFLRTCRADGVDVNREVVGGALFVAAVLAVLACNAAWAMPVGPGSHASHGAGQAVSALRVSIPIAGETQ